MSPFPEEPRSDHEILRAVWEDVKNIKLQVEKTNGRVASLEKFRYAAAGALAVVTTIVVPLFISVVLER